MMAHQSLVSKQKLHSLTEPYIKQDMQKLKLKMLHWKQGKNRKTQQIEISLFVMRGTTQPLKTVA